MVLENICPPALLYLAFSVIQIIIDMYRGDTIQAFFKFIVMIIFTIVLNAICNSGMTIISWFIVFIPFILMTYVTTILFFIFGVNPSKIAPAQTKCSETKFGCCPDGLTAKSDSFGRDCPRAPGSMRLADVLKVPEPIPANNKDGQYLYPQGRSSSDYQIDKGNEKRYKDNSKDERRNDSWRNKNINDWENEYYNSKKIGKDKDRLRSNYSPKGVDKYNSKPYRNWKDKNDNSSMDPKMIAKLIEEAAKGTTGGKPPVGIPPGTTTKPAPVIPPVTPPITPPVTLPVPPPAPATLTPTVPPSAPLAVTTTGPATAPPPAPTAAGTPPGTAPAPVTPEQKAAQAAAIKKLTQGCAMQ